MTTQRRCARSWRRGDLAWVCAAALVAAMCVPHAASADDTNKTSDAPAGTSGGDANVSDEIEAGKILADGIIAGFKLVQTAREIKLNAKSLKGNAQKACKIIDSITFKLQNTTVAFIPFASKIGGFIHKATLSFCMMTKHWDELVAPFVTKKELLPPRAARVNPTIMSQYVSKNLKVFIHSFLTVLVKYIPKFVKFDAAAADEIVASWIKPSNLDVLSAILNRVHEGKVDRGMKVLLEKLVLNSIKFIVSMILSAISDDPSKFKQNPQPEPKEDLEPKPKPNPQPEPKEDPESKPITTPSSDADQNSTSQSSTEEHPSKQVEWVPVVRSDSHADSSRTWIIVACVLAVLAAIASILLLFWQRKKENKKSRAVFRLQHDAPDAELVAIGTKRSPFV